MNKNNSPQFSDEQLERIARTVLRSVILTDEETDEIADAPQVWRKLQNDIALEKARRAAKKGWVFFGWNWRARALAFGALALLSLVGAAILLSDSTQTQVAAVRDESSISAPAENSAPPLPANKLEEKSTASQSFAASSAARARRISADKSSERRAPKILLKPEVPRSSVVARKSEKENKQSAKAATDFIALSYLPQSESGQIVSVRVPRSLMVALGVTTNADRNSELVKAEVVLGDDGAARAIRFLKD